MPAKEKELRKRLLSEAEEALRTKDGRRSMELADRVLEEDERCAAAWLIAMKSFQLFLPIEACQASNEIECARYAIRFAAPGEKYRMRKQVYEFFLHKIIAVLKRDEQALADGREAMSFYQRLAYLDASHAPQKTAQWDRPLVEAVQKSFVYCRELFEFIPDSALKRNAGWNRLAAEAAEQWKRTCSYLEIRFEMYRWTMSREMAEDCVRQYARFLRAVRDRDERLRETLPFDRYHPDAASYPEHRG